LDQLARGSHISGLNLSDSSASLSFDLADKTLVSCTLDRCNLDNSSFARCKLRDLSLEQGSLRLAVFDGCQLDDVNFNGTDLTGTLFSDTKINDKSSFVDAILIDVRFNRCQLTANTVRAATLTGATFNGCRGLDAAATALLSAQNPAIA
jgi:uncharacterized protein YjbI with pentapeptide repeats